MGGGGLKKTWALSMQGMQKDCYNTIYVYKALSILYFMCKTCAPDPYVTIKYQKTYTVNIIIQIHMITPCDKNKLNFKIPK